jgi:hypothetical protein
MDVETVQDVGAAEDRLEVDRDLGIGAAGDRPVALAALVGHIEAIVVLVPCEGLTVQVEVGDRRRAGGVGGIGQETGVENDRGLEFRRCHLDHIRIGNVGLVADEVHLRDIRLGRVERAGSLEIELLV